MTLKFCPSCGDKLIRITSKTSAYKAVCLDCELTYKVINTDKAEEVIVSKPSSPSQTSEAVISKK